MDFEQILTVYLLYQCCGVKEGIQKQGELWLKESPSHHLFSWEDSHKI